MLPDDLICKFTAEIEEQNGKLVVELPASEMKYKTLNAGDICQVSVQQLGTSSIQTSAQSTEPTPPVSPGERRTVEIADVGEKGDGIARVDRGYVLIIPGAAVGDEVTVEVQEVQSNYGFAKIIEETETRESV